LGYFFIIFEELPKENNRPMGENSPNPVILATRTYLENVGGVCDGAGNASRHHGGRNVLHVRVLPAELPKKIVDSARFYKINWFYDDSPNKKKRQKRKFRKNAERKNAESRYIEKKKNLT
jgi:hypothetical protein